MSTENTKSLNQLIEKESVTGAAEERPSLEAKIEKTKTRKKSYYIDLRIHTPCSLGYLTLDGIDTAPALVRLAKVKGLDVIAVTDYCSGEYIDRVARAAQGSDLRVIPGVVLRCTIAGCADVVLSCLFPENCSTQRVRDFLTALAVPESARGDKNYTVTAPFEKVLSIVQEFNGVAIPSRMDKTPYRKSALYALVERYGFRTFDLAYAESVQYFKATWPKLKFHLFHFSSATALAQVGNRRSRVKLLNPGFEGIREIAGRDGDAALSGELV